MFDMISVAFDGEFAPGLNLVEDLELDSLQALELVVLTEDMAGLVVPPETEPLIFTLGDAFEYYKGIVAMKQREDW
jgi:acyl carrier protein